jgi:hypothetical protein
MRFHVVGIDAVTGKCREQDVEALTEKGALSVAKLDGIYPTKIVLLKSALTIENQRFTSTLTVLLCIVLIPVFLIGINFLADMDHEPSTEINTQDSPAYAYDPSGDSHLINIPSMRGFKDLEKEHVISKSKQFD